MTSNGTAVDGVHVHTPTSHGYRTCCTVCHEYATYGSTYTRCQFMPIGGVVTPWDEKNAGALKLVRDRIGVEKAAEISSAVSVI